MNLIKQMVQGSRKLWAINSLFMSAKQKKILKYVVPY